ncbi:exodeoxyribonuclease VII large subunit [Pseudodesulfovibrio senegalensis]|uniref:Exodeoxyribonuclease 7 large subunit n=1 Tax=Pseudodesulfovibrio senegalensis TaxID=1721087 RepID=A0A6N6N672_9BACT|nr:exodeoxyribonuclease VII large subunit [Pseudodesulfovibrio senegalensis]KAB1442979.1 exodeoxyribonuclease VII large subunit [Pseudodesulfovibrio senegalensis]
MSAILSVSELTRAVKDLLEAEFPFVWVRGQVTNLARPASGHIYFSLTDGDAVLGTVWFRGAQRATEPESRGGEAVNPLTGEVEESVGPGLSQRLEDGMEVLCAGRLNVFEPRGQYQLVAELVQEQGVGDLRMAFEALKKKLADKGYFDEDRKMAVPSDPARVAVVTSPHGAAIRDFLRLAETRGTGAEIRIYPTLVQGDKAPEQIAGALDMVGEDQWAEAVVLIRGGGSLEDLWAFNTEPVADAIFRSQVPVVCGVGHEPDVSIADFVADRRVATPSHAAQELWPRRETLMQSVDRLEIALSRAYHAMLRDHEAGFAQLRRALVLLSPARRLARQQEALESFCMRLHGAAERLVREKNGRAAALVQRLARAHGADVVERRGQQVDGLVHGLQNAMDRLLERASAGFETTAASLAALNPERPLEQGYGLVRVRNSGKFLRSPGEVSPGDVLDIRVREGSVTARVTEESEENR